MTTLLHRRRYPVQALSDIYQNRCGVEEMYKVVKRMVGLEPFHGQSERGARQELSAGCILTTMARLFTNYAEQDFRSEAGKPPCRPTSATACAQSASISKGCSCGTPPRWATPSTPSWTASRTAASASVRTVPIRVYPAGPTTDSDPRSRACPLLQPESSSSRHQCLLYPPYLSECTKCAKRTLLDHPLVQQSPRWKNHPSRFQSNSTRPARGLYDPTAV